MAKRRAAWPQGFDRISYAGVVREAILGAAEKARLASISTGIPPEDVPHLREWAARLATVEDLWLEEGGSTAASAVKMVEHAFDATVIADAGAPFGMHTKVEGGLIVQWVRLLTTLDAKWTSRKPRTASELARRIVVEWSDNDNPDRRSGSVASALDTASANLLFQALDGPGLDSLTDVLDIAYEEADALTASGSPVPYSRRRLDRWAAYARRIPKTEEAGTTTTGAGRRAAAVGAVASAGASTTAQTVAEVTQTVVETASSFDRALVSVVSSLDSAFSAANNFVKRAAEAVGNDRSKRRRGRS